MKYRKLGKTGLQVSEIGFGAWGLGGDSYGPVDDQVSRQALHLAFERGINFFDTADLYGAGHSEEILASAFVNCRSQIIIASKVGTLPHTGFYMPQDFSANHIMGGLEASLRRLGTDYIDLYQLHSPQFNLPNWDEIISVMQQLVQAGKIRTYGVSARSPADARLFVQEYEFPVIQVNFNMIDQRALEIGLFELCRKRGIGLIARTPLCFGYLSGKLTGDEAFIGRDHRANWPREQLQRWADAARLFSKLNAGLPRTMVQLALQFCIADPAVSTVIPGLMTNEEVVENVAASDLPPLTTEELEAIAVIYQTHSFYDPTLKQAALQADPAASKGA